MSEKETVWMIEREPDKDALRYRWLRVMWWNFGSSNYPMPPKIGGAEFWERLDSFCDADTPEKLDAAIDAAIASGKCPSL